MTSILEDILTGEEETYANRVEVRDIFDSPKLGKIAGCLVIEGLVIKSNPIRILRDNTVITVVLAHADFPFFSREIFGVRHRCR